MPLLADRPLLVRWVTFTVAGEALGFGVPAVVGASTYAAGVNGPSQMAWLVVAGTIEGALLGLAQSFVLRRCFVNFAAVPWIRNTALAAMFAWTLGMTPSTLGDRLVDYWYISVPAAVILAPVLLVSVGFAQWLVLRHHITPSRQWIAANTIGWLVGITWIFVAMAFVSEGDPTWAVALAGAVGGFLMAVTIAIATGTCLIWLLDHRVP